MNCENSKYNTYNIMYTIHERIVYLINTHTLTFILLMHLIQ